MTKAMQELELRYRGVQALTSLWQLQHSHETG